MNKEDRTASSSENVLELRDLTVHFVTEEETVEAVDHISITLKKGEILGLVGETGAGKTTTALAILNLVPVPPGVIKSGSIRVCGRDVLNAPVKELEQIRGSDVSMIFQDPMTSLNPVFTVGDQIAESVMFHENCTKAEAWERAEEMLELVGIPQERAHEYPHQFSGGMKQRVVIAIALAVEPRLIICDEPVSALDVSIQAQILNLLQELQQQLGFSYIFITHDLAVVNHISDNIMVMYLGQVVEMAPSEELFRNPVHPYTQALLSAIPIPKVGVKQQRVLLKGEISSPIDPEDECRFARRCGHTSEACHATCPKLREIAPGHFVACHLFGV